MIFKIEVSQSSNFSKE